MFDSIIGNKEVKEYLEKITNSGTNSNSYIFSGKNGIGKKLIAREWARLLLCENEEEKNKFDNNAHPDYKEIVPEDKTLKIEQIRQIQEKIIEKPILSKKKIYIIDNSETMTEEAQNCLLKTLEEPPSYAIIILITSNENRLLQTIKSRCLNIKFKDLTEEEIKQIVGNIPNDMIEMFNGSLAEIDLIKSNYEKFSKLSNFIDRIKNEDLQELITNNVLYDSKEIILNMLDYLCVLLYKNRLINTIEIVEKTRKKILLNNNYEMTIDYLVINLWKIIH